MVLGAKHLAVDKTHMVTALLGLQYSPTEALKCKSINMYTVTDGIAHSEGKDEAIIIRFYGS